MAAFDGTTRLGTPPLGRARPARGMARTSLARMGPLAQLRAGRLGRRLPQLYAGLVLYGLSLAMLIRARLGNAPWDVLHQGLARHLPLSIGGALVVASFVVLLLWIPLGELPGLGTVSNALLVGVATDYFLGVIATPPEPGARALLTVGGVALCGVASALYLGAQLGAGPRDGLMTGLHRRTGLPLGVVRTALEVTVVLVGWALGGTLGVGTVFYALAIGPLTQAMLPWAVVELPSVAGRDQR